MNTVAAVYHSMGDNDRAIVTYESALAVNEPLGRFGFAALVLGNIARIRASRSEYLPAVSLGRRAVDLARKHSPDIVSNLLADLAEAYMGLADHERASECFAEARRVWEERADHGIEPVAGDPARRDDGRGSSRPPAAARSSEAISVLQAALDMAERTDSREFELEINDLLATAFKRSGRFEEALDRREKHDSQYRQMFTHATDLRLRTLQVAHETATARQQAEILRLRTHELEAMVTTDGQPIVRSANQLDAFERLAVLAEFRDTDTGQHTKRVGDMAAEIAHARGENPDWAERLRLAARLHDIGKVSVPDAVLLKSGPLTVEEFEIMKTHTTVGNQILAGSSSPTVPDGGRDRRSPTTSGGTAAAIRTGTAPSRSHCRVASSPSPTCSTRCAAGGPTSARGRWARPPGSSCPDAAPSSSPTSSTPSSPCCSPATPSSRASWAEH